MAGDTDFPRGDRLAVLALVQSEFYGEGGDVWDVLSDNTRSPREDRNWRLLTMAVDLIVQLLDEARDARGVDPRDWIDTQRAETIRGSD